MDSIVLQKLANEIGVYMVNKIILESQLADANTQIANLLAKIAELEQVKKVLDE